MRLSEVDEAEEPAMLTRGGRGWVVFVLPEAIVPALRDVPMSVSVVPVFVPCPVFVPEAAAAAYVRPAVLRLLVRRAVLSFVDMLMFVT